jgi:hypothetical protein
VLDTQRHLSPTTKTVASTPPLLLEFASPSVPESDSPILPAFDPEYCRSKSASSSLSLSWLTDSYLESCLWSSRAARVPRASMTICRLRRSVKSVLHLTRLVDGASSSSLVAWSLSAPQLFLAVDEIKDAGESGEGRGLFLRHGIPVTLPAVRNRSGEWHVGVMIIIF